MALLAAGGLFVARLIPDAGTLLRDADEAHFCAAAARLAATCSPEIVAEAHARMYRRLTGKMI